MYLNMLLSNFKVFIESISISFLGQPYIIVKRKMTVSPAPT